MKNIWQVDAWPEKEWRDHPDYAVWAAHTVKQLYPVLAAKLECAQLSGLYDEIELALVDVLSNMEYSGIAVDGHYLQIMSADIADKVSLLLADIYQLAGEEFNVNSTKKAAGRHSF